MVVIALLDSPHTKGKYLMHPSSPFTSLVLCGPIPVILIGFDQRTHYFPGLPLLVLSNSNQRQAHYVLRPLTSCETVWTGGLENCVVRQSGEGV